MDYMKIDRLPDIPYLHYEDTSTNKASQINREVQQSRVDDRNNTLEIIDALTKSDTADSPYAPDRPSINPNRILSSANEGNWKKVPSYDELWNSCSNNLKRLRCL